MPPPRLKRSNTAGASPASLEDGEIAINQADGTLYYRTTAAGVGALIGSGAQGPRGETGPQGPRGETGPQGVAGPPSIFVANALANFPATGASDALYVSTSAKKIYLWQATQYVEISSGGEDSAPSAVFLSSPPPTITRSAGDNYVDLSWEAPTALSVLPVLSYSVQFRQVGGQFSTFNDSVSSNAVRVTGLTAGQSYEFKIAARNSVGLGSYSSPTPASLVGSRPGAPVGLAATAGALSVTLAWTSPAGGGVQITAYEIERMAADEVVWTAVSRQNPALLTETVAQLAGGLLYRFRVRAINGIGPGEWSEATATPIHYDDLWSSVVLLMNMEGTGSSFTDLSNYATALTAAPLLIGGAVPLQTTQYARSGSKSADIAPNAFVRIANGPSTQFSGAFTLEMWIRFKTKPTRSLNILHPTVRAGQVFLGTAGNGQGLSYGRAYVGAYLPSAPAVFEAGVWYHIAVVRTPDFLVNMYVDGKRITASGLLDKARNVTALTGDIGLCYPISRPGAECYLDEVRFTKAARYTADFVPLRGAFPTDPLPTAASAPRDLILTPSDSSLALSWTVPSSTGGAAISGYRIEYRELDGDWIVYNSGASNGTGTTATITPIANGREYEVRVAAMNSLGQGLWVTSPLTLVAALPAQVTGLVAVAGHQQLCLSWTAPDDGGAEISDYSIQINSGSGWSSFAHTPSVNTYATITNLTNGTAYQLRVAAITQIGTGSPSAEVTATPILTLPPAPTGLAATLGVASATLFWDDASGSACNPITKYILSTSTNGGAFVDAAPAAVGANSVVVSGLANGSTYVFRLAYQSNAGIGPWSANSNSVTPSAAPSAPASLTATVSSNQVALSWTASAANGSAIQDYIVQYNTGGVWTQVEDGVNTSTTYTVTGLAAGTYTFRVSARNAQGDSPPRESTAVTIATPPGSPTGLQVTATASRQATLGWTVPASNGGAAITGYTVEYTPSGGSATSVNVAGPTSATVTGLTNGVSYSFRVLARNSAGSSSPSTAASATVTGVADAPTNVTNTAGTATVAWTAPADTGGVAITVYTIEYTPSGGTALTTTSATTSKSLTLTAGITYSVRVRADNSRGNGVPSTAISVKLVAAPAVVTGVTATAGNGSVALAWTAPSMNGGTLVRYRVRRDGVEVSTPTSTSATITGLTNGTSYSFTVAAENEAGIGPYSTAVTSVPVTVPSAPQSVSATAGIREATVSWSVPSSNGGSAIQSYRITGGPVTVVASTSPATVTGLQNNTSYTFSVAATNAVGTGATASASSVTTKAVPSAPTSLSSTSADTSITLNWSAPVSDGGMAIINYRVTYVSTPASGSVIVTATTFTLDSLPAGTIVTFSVAAQSAVGFGAESSVLQATAGIPPSAPTGLTATAGNARIDLSWTAPSSDGGSAITGYAVEYTRSGYPPETVSTGSTSTIYPLTGLTNGEAYTVRVAAVNAAGPGAYTAASSSVTPAPPPPITRNNGSGSGTSASKWTLATVYPACDFQGRFITANSAVTVLVDSVNSVGCGCDAGEIWNIAHRNASGTLLSGIHDNYNQTFLGKSFTLSAGDYLYVDIQCAINTYRAWVP
jgi:hypothetical protein